jgi:hypothetical protein
MKSIVWKSVIIAVFVVLSHCVKEPSSTIHPVFTLKEERLTDTTALVILSTTDAKDYSLYRIVDDTCMLEVTYYAIIGGIKDTYDTSIAIANDSAAYEKGTFSGTLGVQFSNVDIGTQTIEVDTMRIFGYVTDETGHEACATIIMLGDTTSVK